MSLLERVGLLQLEEKRVPRPPKYPRTPEEIVACANRGNPKIRLDLVVNEDVVLATDAVSPDGRQIGSISVLARRPEWCERRPVVWKKVGSGQHSFVRRVQELLPIIALLGGHEHSDALLHTVVQKYFSDDPDLDIRKPPARTVPEWERLLLPVIVCEPEELSLT